ncbi:MAG: NADH-ubiquinone oxidoreductase-F iron-sulfur binding region domain-containing protein [Pseudomonadales bacterium]
MSKNISKLTGRKGLRDNLFDRLKTDAVQNGGAGDAEISDHYFVGKSTLLGSRSFYDFLDRAHLNKKAWICNGTSCLCSGDIAGTKSKLEKKLGEGNVGTMTCLGHCYEANSFHYQGRNYSGTQMIGAESPRTYEVRCASDTCILTDSNFSDLVDFQSALENLFKCDRLTVLSVIKDSALRGRGGAGFPAGLKWESCMQVEANTKYVVCNADEGDPGAFSDRYLLEQQSLRVIFGMVVAGWIAGANEGVVYIRAEYPESVSTINHFIQALQSEGLLGDDILGSNFNFDLMVIEGAGAYICGEETALIASIEGRRPEVDVRPPFPTIEGLYKQPTILNNVETFAAIQRILDLGGEAFAAIGTDGSSGTKLVSLDAGFNRPGIIEIEMGMPLSELIFDFAEGFRQATKAIHIGGPLGGLVPIEKISELTVDYETFSQKGFLLGHASLVCIPKSFPMIRYLEHLFEFTKDESCGKCFPCRLGSTRGFEMLQLAATGERLLDKELLTDLLETMEIGSLCALGGGLPLPIKNALQYFEEELSEYFETDDLIKVKQL